MNGYVLLVIFLFAMFWISLGDGSDRIQPIDIVICLGVFVILGICMFIEHVWYDKTRNPGGRLTRKQIEDLERKAKVKKHRDKGHWYIKDGEV